MANTPSPHSLVARSRRRATAPSGVDVESRVDLVEDANGGRSTPSCSVSLRLRSPPDRSTFSGRARNRSSKPMARPRLVGSRSASGARCRGPAPARTSAAASSAPRARRPGTSIGCCRARNSPARARCHAGSPARSTPVEGHTPPVTSVPGRPMRAWASVLLPDPFGPHDRVDLAAPHREVDTVEHLPADRPDGVAGRRRASTAGAHGTTTDHGVALDLDGVDGHRARWPGSEQGCAGAQIEGAAVPGALDLALVVPHLALGQREVLVAASVADGEEVVADPHQRHPQPGDVEPPGLHRGPGRRPAEHDRAQPPAGRPAGRPSAPVRRPATWTLQQRRCTRESAPAR